MIYSAVKYKDDGRDIVSLADFITIHVTFPAINAWISYQIFFLAELTFTYICDDHQLFDFDNFCMDFRQKNQDGPGIFFYDSLLLPSLVFLCLLFIEASIHLTYYKDVAFALTTLLSFGGMLWVNQKMYDCASSELSKASIAKFPYINIDFTC